MKHLKYLLMAALVAMPLTACDEDDGPIVEPTPTGTITGTVSAEGAGLSGVSVTLVGATSQSATTAANGAYTFTNVPAGSYGVSIDASNHPGVSFSQTSKTTTITTAGQQATVDFSGSFIRTAAITGVVSADGQPLAGVSVAVTGGPGDPKNAVTNAGGEYSVTGLRAGTYTVTISNTPTGVTFTTMTQSVTVATGESKNAHFPGQRPEAPVTASVVIKSVTSGGTLFPVDPDNVTGQMDVTLEIDAGGNQLTSIELYLDDVLVGSQTLGHGVVDQGLEMATFSPVFSVNTARFDAATGAVTFLNKSYVLSAKLGLVGAEKPSVTTSMNLVFRNADRFVVTMTNAGTTANTAQDLAGQIWKRGDVTVSALPAMYSGRTVSSVTLSLHADVWGFPGVSGMNGNFWTRTEGPPFTATWQNTTSTGVSRRTNSIEPGAIIGVVSSSVLSDGSNGPNSIPAVAGNSTAPFFMRLDNRAPSYDNLDRAIRDSRWINGSWSLIGAGFAGTNVTVADGGVGALGGLTITRAVGTTTANVETVPDASVLDETATDNAYVLRLTFSDQLGNSVSRWFDGGVLGQTDNATGRANADAGGRFGVDKTPPIIEFAGGTSGANAITTTFLNYNLAIADPVNSAGGAAGFAANPVRVRSYRTHQTLSSCAYQFISNACRFTAITGTVFQAGAGGTPNANTEGYFDSSFYVIDRAGNVSETLNRWGLADWTPPVLGSVAVPGSLTGGMVAPFAVAATDNLNLGTAEIFMHYAAIRIGFEAPRMLGTFGIPLNEIQATVTSNHPFIRRVQFTDVAGVPAGGFATADGVSFDVYDLARNMTSGFGPFAYAAPPTAPGTFDAAWTWTHTRSPATGDICLDGPNVACAAGLTSVTFNPSLLGPTAGLTNPPFQNVVIVWSSDGTNWYRLGANAVASATGDNVTRTWTFGPVTFAPPATFQAPGTTVAYSFIAIGYNAAGDALLSPPVTVTVERES